MNIQKIIAIVAAILINVLVLAWFHAWTTSIVADATPIQRTDAVLTLPVITMPVVNVYPTRAQLEKLRREGRRASGGGIASARGAGA